MHNKILITGAAGFIGSHLVDTLLKNGVRISTLRLFVFPGESLANLPKEKFDIVYGDVRDKKAVKQAMKNVTTVYHLAARIDFDGKTYEEYEEVNVSGTRNFVEEAVKNTEFKKFVNYSSIGVYGLPAGIGNIINWNESHEPTFTNFYGRSKWEAEKVVRTAHKKYGLPYAIIRPASVYGPREKGPTLALFKAIKLKQFILIGNGENKMHYVYVQDLIDATILSAQSKQKSSEYIIAGNEPTSFKKVAQLVAKNCGVSIPKYYLPKSLALLISYFLLGISQVTGISFPLFPSRVKTMTATYYYSIKKAKKELGFIPKVSFEDGIQKTANWYKQKKYI